MKLKKLLAVAMAAVMLISTIYVRDTSAKEQYSAPTKSTESILQNGSSNISTPEQMTEIKGSAGKNAGTLVNKNQVVNELSGETLDALELKKNYEKKLNESLGLKYEGNVNEEDVVRVIITLRGDSVVEYDNKATMNAHTAIRIEALEKAQERIIGRIEKNVLDGEALDVHYQYTWLLNGIAASVPYGKIEEIREVAGVKSVLLQPYYLPCETVKSDAEISTIYDGMMIGRQPAWESGYTGKGMKIAVIDTGIDEDHQSFGALSDDLLTEDSVDMDTISNVLAELNASTKMEGLRAEQLYLNTKIAYALNYVDANLRINHSYDTMGDHGTHVAGIAAANKISESEVVGVAPDAQLMIMKVFGQNGGAYIEDMLASVEDALILGADVINMSLGSNAGFTSATEDLEGIYDRVSKTDTILAVAAGNSASMGSGNLWDSGYGIPHTLATNPDNSVVSSPSTYGSALSVGSVENVMLKDVYYLTMAGVPMLYFQTQDGNNDNPLVLGGQKLNCAVVGNCGQTLEDFLAADVAGKVAIVSRGVTTFASKVELAQQAGAIAVVIYNNTTGDLHISLEGCNATIPAASVSLKVGQFILSVLEQNPEETLEFSTGVGDVENEAGNTMSTFSSWGAAPDLTLKPEISAPGGNIYSCYDNGAYGLMSGTSMATPNVAGIAALVIQYVKDTYPEMKDGEIHAFVNALLMSTASPITNPEGLTYSPRLQGAGLANAYNAINTRAYLLVDGCERPKVELFDDPERTGAYGFSFTVKNFGDEALYYNAIANALTESIDETYNMFISETPTQLEAEIELGSDHEVLIYDYTENGKTGSEDARLLYFAQMSDEFTKTTDRFRYDLDCNEASDTDDVQAYLDALVGKGTSDLEKKAICVAPGEEADVAVAITLSEADKEYMDTFFTNGIYVEGFAGVEALNDNGVDLSLPYLAFYGDWTEAPIFDSGYYYQPEEELVASQYYNVLFTNINGVPSGWNPGMNPYVEAPFRHDFVSVSPNGDGNADYVDDIYVSLLRNAKTLSFTYSNADTGEVYYEVVADEVVKSCYNAGYGLCPPFMFYELIDYGLADYYYFTDKEGNTLPNGTKVKLTVAATLDYDRHESANRSDTWETTFTVDMQAPVLDKTEFVVEDGRTYVDLTFSDNVGVAGINFIDTTGTMIYATLPCDDVAVGEVHTQRFDVTGFGNQFYVVFGDYALNESFYLLETTDNLPRLDESMLYGYRVFDENISDDSVFAWVSIDPKTGAVVAQNSEIYMDYAINAATYVGGYIYAIDANNTLYAIVPGLWNQRIKIAELDINVSDMTFDPVDQKLYAFDKNSFSLVEIDLYQGSVTNLGYFGGNAVAMASTKEGELYFVDDFANLYRYNKEFMFAEFICELGSLAGTYAPHYLQSMTYFAADDCLYWAAYDLLENGDHGVLVKIDLSGDLAEASFIGTVGGNAEIVGLMNIADDGFVFGESVVESITMDKSKATLLVDRELELSVQKNPWFGTMGNLVWTSSDDSVATVADGVVYGVSEGVATITATTEDGTLSTSCEIYVKALETELNGFILGGTSTKFQWTSFHVSDLEDYTLSEMDDRIFVAGDYANGYLYAYDAKGDFFRLDPVTYEEKRISAALTGYVVLDMAYNTKQGAMYVLIADAVMGYTSIAPINLLNGEIDFTKQVPCQDAYFQSICTLAASDEAGVFYGISMGGFLCRIDTNAFFTEDLMLTGFTGSSHNQSMAYDQNENALYWAVVSKTGEVTFLYIDLETMTSTALGSIDKGVQMTCLYASNQIEDREPVVAESVMADSEVILLEGMTSGLPITLNPLNSTDLPCAFAIEDETIATIDDGIVTGLKAGETMLYGTIGGHEFSIKVKVRKAANSIFGNVLSDLSTTDGDFFGEFSDVDMLHGSIVSPSIPYSVYAGAYYNGRLYAYGFNHESFEYSFLVYNAENGYALEKSIPGVYPDVMDMAFDYTTGVMYAIAGTKNVSSICTLYQVDLETGKMYPVGNTGKEFYGLACDDEGNLYAVDSSGDLYILDKETGYANYFFSTFVATNQYQSMSYDYNTGNLYWAQTYYSGVSIDGILYYIDLESQKAVKLGKLGDNGCEITAMHTIPEKEPVTHSSDVKKIVFGNTHGMIALGETLLLDAVAYPISVESDAIINFRSMDESIATVDENGVVTAVGEGDTDIVASYGSIEAKFAIHVIGDSTLLHIGTENGMQTSPLLIPGTASGSATYPEAVTMKTMTYNQADGYLYGITTEGYLYRYTEDYSVFEKVIEQTVFDVNGMYVDPIYPEYGARIFDLTYNAFDGQMYVLYFDSMMFSNAIGKLDVETGMITYLSSLFDVNIPNEFVFVDAYTAIVYDNLEDIVYRVDAMSGMCEKILFAQEVVVGDELHAGMYYSTKLDVIFFATVDTYYGNAGSALYLIDIKGNTIEKLQNAAYNNKLIDIYMIEE